MQKKLVFVLFALALAFAAVFPAFAAPSYCTCQACATASPGARCTLPGTSQVVTCDDYEYYYCYV